MNVQKGDLVRYVGNNPRNRPNVYGWIGVAVKYTRDDAGEACWIVEPPLPGGMIHDRPGWSRDGSMVHGDSLRPIRNDPGQDQTLLWCDVPTTDKAAA